LCGGGAYQQRTKPVPLRRAQASRNSAALAAVRTNAPLDASDVESGVQGRFCRQISSLAASGEGD